MDYFHFDHTTGGVRHLGRHNRVREAVVHHALPADDWRNVVTATTVAECIKTAGSALHVAGVQTAYTVLLLTPDYLASTFGQDTYQAHVQASNSDDAITAARRVACEERGNSIEDDADNYHVLAVFVGELEDLNNERP